MTVMELIHEIYGEFEVENPTEAQREALNREVVIKIEGEDIVEIHEVTYDGVENRVIIETGTEV